jgi:hypothetical protein
LNIRETANIYGTAQLPSNAGSGSGTSTTTVEDIAQESLEVVTPEGDSELTITDEMKAAYPNLFGN